MTIPSSLADLASIFDSQPISGMRNRIINGDMRIDQRNAGASASIGSGAAAYTVDRNGVFNSGSNTITAQRITGPTGFQNALRITGSASNIGVSWYQRIEANNTYDLASTIVTFSATVSASSSRNITPSVTIPNSFENFGSQTSGGSTTWAVTTTPTRFFWSFTMPANAVNGVEMAFALGSLLAGETVTITGVQLEAGPFATPFERRSFGQELFLCQRYYAAQSASQITRSYNYSSITVDVWHFVCLPATMRAVPTVTAVLDINDGAPVSPSFISPTTTSFGLTRYALASLAFLDLNSWTASAEL